MLRVAKPRLIIFAGAVVALFLILLLFVVNQLNIFNSGEQEPFQNINPGQTSTEDVFKNLGNPILREEKDGGQILYYTTESKFYQNTVKVRGGTVSYTREYLITPVRIESYKKTYGEPDLLLFDTETENAMWATYLNKGIAFNTDGNEVFQIVRFSPTTKTIFLTLGSELGMSEKEPEETLEPELEPEETF